MAANELEGVKQDIATIKEAAGLELPFGWADVWLGLFGVPAVAAWFLACVLIFDRPSRLIRAVPIIPFLAVLGYLRFKHRRSTGSSAIKRREYGISFYGSIVLLAGGAVFVTWARLSAIETAYLGSGLVTMCGLMGTLIAFQGKQRISYLGGSIPVILFGISIAIWPSSAAVTLNGGITLFVTGPAMALIMMYQLKHSGTEK